MSTYVGNEINLDGTHKTNDTRTHIEGPMVELFSSACSLAVIFGGLVPYIPQYLTIRRTENCDGFSTYVCLTLLLANILRILFWFGHPFELPLLIQSYVMIIGMLVMIEICVRVKNRGLILPTSRQRRFLGKSARMYRSHDLASPIYHHDDKQLTCRYTTSIDSTIEEELKYSLSMNQEQCDETVSYQSGQVDNLKDGPTQNEMQDLNQLEGSQNRINAKVQETQNLYAQKRLRLVQNSNHNRNYFNNSHGSVIQNDSYMEIRYFWQWTDFLSYVEFLGAFTLVASLVTYIFIDYSVYVETLGFMAVLTESMLGIPQMLRNYTKSSTRGMSVVMVTMWLTGDIFKTTYFIVKSTPQQFWICGLIQVFIDLIIIGQVLWYSKTYTGYNHVCSVSGVNPPSNFTSGGSGGGSHSANKVGLLSSFGVSATSAGSSLSLSGLVAGVAPSSSTQSFLSPAASTTTISSSSSLDLHNSVTYQKLPKIY